MSNRKKPICVYCGVRPGTTRDHVPPKCLFGPNSRTNLITVPACPVCHDAYKLDDEYFRTVLAMRSGLAKSDSGLHIQDATRRAFADPARTGLRSRVLRDIGCIGSASAGQFVLRLESERIKSTTRRIVAGLSSHVLKAPVPATHEVDAFPLDLQKGPTAIEHPLVRECLKQVQAHGTPIEVGDVLSARYANAIDDSETTMWLLVVHRVFLAFGYVTPKAA